jgi:hypothetical protein
MADVERSVLVARRDNQHGADKIPVVNLNSTGFVFEYVCSVHNDSLVIHGGYLPHAGFVIE